MAAARVGGRGREAVVPSTQLPCLPGNLSTWCSSRSSSKAKSHGRFDSFLWDCLAMWTSSSLTKPAAESGYFCVHTPGPAGMQSKEAQEPVAEWPAAQPGSGGMLEAGVDRSISQVVDPERNHLLRPQREPAILQVPGGQDLGSFVIPCTF